jgi:hypothetical protein
VVRAGKIFTGKRERRLSGERPRSELVAAVREPLFTDAA